MRAFPHILLLSLTLAAGQMTFPGAGFGAPTVPERAEELLKAGNAQQAIAKLSSYRPSRQELSAYHYAYARALVKQREPYRSIEHYRLAYVYAASAADKERMLFERAQVYAGMGYSSEAVVCFDVFLQLFPKSNFAESAELGIAESRYDLGQYHEALDHYDKAGSSLRAMYGRANTLQALGRAAEARRIYSDLIENDPEVINSSQETLYRIGENYRQLGDLGNAKIYYTSVKDNPIKYRAIIGLGMIAMQELRFKKAVQYFTDAAESPERQVRREAILDRAEAKMRMGNTDEAEAALREIKDSYPYGAQYDTASLLLARLYRDGGKFEESIAVLKSLIYRRSPSVAALDDLEAILLETMERDRNTFVKVWNDVGRWLLDPARSSAVVKFAKGLRSTGKTFIDVCAWLLQNGTDEAKTEGRLLLAGFYADMGDTSSAWSYLLRAKSKDHGDEILRIKAKTYLVNNKPDRASKAIMALRRPKDADLLILFDAMKSLDKIDEGIRFYTQTARKTRLAPRTTVRFADVLYNAGRTGEALAYYKAATAAAGSGQRKMPPDIAWAHYRIAELARGAARTASLEAVGTEKDTAGKFAAAELQAAGLRKRIEQAGL